MQDADALVMNSDILQGLLPNTGPELILYLVLGVVLPSLVALVTKRLASGQVKSVTLILLSVISSVVTELAQNGSDFSWKTALARTVALFYVAIGLHFGLLKGALTGTNGALARVAPDAGVGTRQLTAVVNADLPARGASALELTDEPGKDVPVSSGIVPNESAQGRHLREESHNQD